MNYVIACPHHGKTETSEIPDDHKAGFRGEVSCGDENAPKPLRIRIVRERLLEVERANLSWANIPKDGRVLANVPTDDDRRRRPKENGRHRQMPHFGELAGLPLSSGRRLACATVRLCAAVRRGWRPRQDSNLRAAA